jgi:hypothetical protein
MIGPDNGEARALSSRNRGNEAAVIMERNPKRGNRLRARIRANDRLRHWPFQRTRCHSISTNAGKREILDLQ